MVRIIPYSDVFTTLTKQGLRCNYHNSGAFGFAAGVPQFIRGWIGPEDGSIKPAMREFIRKVPAPYEENLAESASQTWREFLPGNIWLMPLSHWAFELGDGSRHWMPQLLNSLGIDPAPLVGLNNASAIEFAVHETDGFRLAVGGLLEHLSVSDFLLAFPGQPVVCTLHHHKQLWWVTPEAPLVAALDKLVPPESIL